MKIPLSWLQEYVDLNLEPAQLIERLTIAGLEVARVQVFGHAIPPGVRVKAEDRGPVWERDKVVVAEVLSVEKHPNADKLKLPTVAYGDGRVKRLVTGAPNLHVGDRGQKVVLGLTGAVLFDGHSDEKKLLELKPTKIRGEPSDAMVCSLQELGLPFDPKADDGIVFLDDDAPVGLPLVDYLGDLVVEVDVLPNMARCLAMLGVAREVAALTGARLRLPPAGVQTGAEPAKGLVTVQIEDPARCARYAASIVRGVSRRPAPGWMQRRLRNAGMRPIDNIVDVTNYVMLEWGQPLHAFDYDVLVKRAGGGPPAITVRAARPGETLVTLDGVERTLSPENLVIADARGAIALAGVMGGRDTEVTAETKNLLLESASFDAVSIRKTARQFELHSEASLRFARGIHPETVLPAMQRAAELLRLHAGGQVCAGMVEAYPAPRPPQTVELKLSQVERLLGTPFPADDALRILRALEFDVAQLDDDTLQARVPDHRLDIQVGASDLIEDLVRIRGYDRLPATLLADRLPEQHTNAALVFEESLRDLLVDLGLQEVMTYALTTPEKEAPLLGEPRAYVELKNPISSERSVLRQSVLASVLEVAAANLRHTQGVRLFELGRIYVPQAGQDLPAEPRRLALALTGPRHGDYWGNAGASEPLDFFDLKGLLETLAEDLHLPAVEFKAATAVWLHPGQAAALTAKGQALGAFGLLHPKVAAALGLADRQVLAAELDLEALQAALPPRYAYKPVPRFPAALRDIAVVVSAQTPAERVEKEIRAGGGQLLRDARLFDLYQGESIPVGTKSLAYALSYQADDRTLTDKEVDAAHQKIEKRLKHVLQAQIRGQD